MNPGTELKEALQAIVPAPALIEVAGAATPVVGVPDNYTLVHVDEKNLAKPNQIAAAIEFRQYKEWVAYVNSYKQDGARVAIENDLALRAGGKLATAYLDFPKPGEPRWARHTAVLVVQPSLEYACLTALDSKLLAQDTFAREIVKVARFCTSLSQADLIELAQKLTLTSKGDFRSINDDLSGSVDFLYDVKVSAKVDGMTSKQIAVPSGFSFNMALIHGGAAVDVPTEFAYRVPEEAGGKISLGIRIPDRLYIERDYLEDVVATINKDTDLPTAISSLTSYQK